MSYIGKTPTSVPLTSSDITDGIISLPKLTDGTDGNIISYDASGNPVAVATGTDGQVLTSTGAGSPPAFETLPTNTPAFFAHANGNQTIATSSYTKVEIDTEIVDTNSKFDVANYRFTPAEVGYYIIGGFVRFDSSTTTSDCGIIIYKNGSAYYKHVEGKSSVTTKHINQVVYLDADDYVELYCYQNGGGNQDINGAGSLDTVAATFYGYKILT